MKNKLLTVIFALGTVIGFSQNKNIEILNTQNDKGFIVSVINNSSVQQEVTLTIVPTNLTGYKEPITKLVPSKTTIEIIKLFFIKNKGGSFSTKYSYKPSLTEKEKIAYNKKLEEKIKNDIGNIEKGIVVFSKDGCSRCHYTTSFLLDNNIDFKLINVTKDDKQNLFMWELLKKENPIIKNLTMPVILLDGKISYNIDDLKGFVGKLKNN
ncbi:glutaredoxin family protein [Confluentibacter sediminis]|uniref:glutaredoxin family protein n=1 Tax=Confluentibacter sediminis TaxID=2219045 RepID=UPI000DAEB375|nr:glutaredoxin [Confluentibacter sediminis]